MNEFGAKLRAARRAAGMSQTAMGGSRFTGSYISLLESGRREPTAEVAHYLGGKLGVAASELLGADPTALSLRRAERELILADLRARSAWAEQDFAQAGEDAQRAADAALLSDRADSWWAANALRAQSLLAVSRYVEAWELAEMLAAHPIAEAGPMRAEMLVLASKARRAVGQLDIADARAEKAISAASGQPRQHAAMAHALMARISTQVEVWSTEGALPFADELRLVREHIDSQHLRGQIAWTLGNVDFATGAIERGIVEHDLAARLLRPEVNLRSWARFRMASANARLTAGLTTNVQHYLEAASNAFSLIGHPGDQCELRGVWAYLHLVEEDYERSLAELDVALLAPSPLPDNRLGELEVRRATVLRRLGRIPEAQQMLVRAAKDIERSGATAQALQVWHLHADLIHGTGELVDAGLS